MQQLERRCREYEQAHVQATVEMQAVARKVNEENRLLRSLLNQMGTDDQVIENWLLTQGSTSEGLRNINHPIRQRSQSTSASISSETHHGEDLQFTSDSRAEAVDLQHTQHFSMLNAPMAEPPIPLQTQHTIPLLVEPKNPVHQGLVFSRAQPQPYTYNPTSPLTSGDSTPTTSPVESSPRLPTIDSNYHTFFPGLSPTPSMRLPFSPASPHMELPMQDPKPPLVFIRLDPTNELYKLYPMSTIAIIPWLNPDNQSLVDPEVIHHLSTLNVSGQGISSLSPKAESATLPLSDNSNFDYGNFYTSFSPKQGDPSSGSQGGQPGWG